MAKYLFSNNASTYLTVSISNSATSINLPSGKGALFQNPSSPDYQMATIFSPSAPSTVEIVKITARSGDTLTVTRAQEGTTGLAWAAGSYIENRVTKATLDYLAQNQGTGSDSIGIGTSPTVSGGGAIGLGYIVTASGNDSVAISSYASASATDAIALGHSATASAVDTVAIGHSATASVDSAIAIGKGAQAVNTKNISIGRSVITGGTESCIGIGFDIFNYITRSHVISGASLIQKSASKAGSELIYYAGQETYIYSDNIILTSTATDDIVIWTIPTGATFFPNEFGLSITQADTVTVQPQVSFGISGNTTSLLATVATTKNTVGGRDIFTPISKDGLTGDIRASLKVSATATSLRGRFYIKGILVETQY